MRKIIRYKCEYCGSTFDNVLDAVECEADCERCGGIEIGCKYCNGTGHVEYYHDAGDHFGAGQAPGSGLRFKPCERCNA